MTAYVNTYVFTNYPHFNKTFFIRKVKYKKINIIYKYLNYLLSSIYNMKYIVPHERPWIFLSTQSMKYVKKST